jgi:hypothetical protein
VRWKVILLVVLAAVMGTLILCQVRGLNGPWYWSWQWRRLG